ncbi:hypothetical protein [Winogradskyella sp.]|uniref:hypothetical protein n=1 Tax=Winogradskyella sp. TaxID=1883156 RepID=UPI0026332E07|nr:hypothetical protein [Winogradskyella sp.]
MKNLYFTLGLLMVFNFVFPQRFTHYYPAIEPSFHDQERQERLIDAIEKSEDLKWKKAVVNSNDETKAVVARYNPFIDEIEIKDGERYFKLSKTDNLQITFETTNQTYALKSYKGTDNEIFRSYFIVNTIDNADFIVKKQSYEMKLLRRKLYSLVKMDRKELVKYNHYYLHFNEKLCYLSTNRTVIRKNYPVHKKSIIKYIKEHNLNSKNEADLIKLANYIQSLEA